MAAGRGLLCTVQAIQFMLIFKLLFFFTIELYCDVDVFVNYIVIKLV